MEWLANYSSQATAYDQFRTHRDHRLLLATGLYGEVGSVLSELKKIEREGPAYPHYRQRLMEEIGDCLWYFVRLAAEAEPGLLRKLSLPENNKEPQDEGRLSLSSSLGYAVGALLDCLRNSRSAEIAPSLLRIWEGLVTIAHHAGIALDQAAQSNQAKTESRWPTKRLFHRLLDVDYPIEEQLPRTLTVHFLERHRGHRVEVLLRSNELNIGDRLTDNISDPDDYRYHDIFHMSYGVYLGWSPVTRALLHCKRKSRPEVDENQDGARALIVEEAVSAVVFSRAKRMNYFEGAERVDYDLLKTIQEFVRGFEVDTVPVWQWETAILKGYEVFRKLRQHRGGVISWDLNQHVLKFASAATPRSDNQ